MEKYYFDDYNISKKDYNLDIEKTDQLRKELKKEPFDLDEYCKRDLTYSAELSEAQSIRNKFALKKIGKNIMDVEKDYEKAISYFEGLLDNPYFENDYYVYRQLTILFGKRYTKQYEKQLDIIKRFLKSGIYCSLYIQMWLDDILTFLKEEKSLTTQDEIDEHMIYYMENGNLNKDYENLPVPLADRIFLKRNGYVDIHNQFEYEKDQIEQELELIGNIKKRKKGKTKQMKKEDSKYMVEFFTGVLEHTMYRKTFVYKHLISGYEGLGDYESMLTVLSLFFKKEYRIGPKNQSWFDRRIKIVNEKLGKNYTKMDLKKLNSVVELAEIDRLANNLNSNINQKLSNYELFFQEVDKKFNENGSLSKEEFELIKKKYFLKMIVGLVFSTNQ